MMRLRKDVQGIWNEGLDDEYEVDDDDEHEDVEHLDGKSTDNDGEKDV